MASETDHKPPEAIIYETNDIDLNGAVLRPAAVFANVFG